MISSLCSRYLSYSSTPPRRHRRWGLRFLYVSPCHLSHCAFIKAQKYVAASSSLESEILRLKCFVAFWKFTEKRSFFCILLLVRFLADNENHLPTGRLFVPEQIIITVTSVICAGQGHSLCLLHRHFWLRLSDCLCHAGFCGKEERKTAVG